MTRAAIDDRPTTELPHWKKLARPQRTDATAPPKTPADDDLLDALCSAGWMHFVTIVADEAKTMHRALIQVDTSLVPAERAAKQGALAGFARVLRKAYDRAGLTYPEYLKGLLDGDIG